MKSVLSLCLIVTLLAASHPCKSQQIRIKEGLADVPIENSFEGDIKNSNRYNYKWVSSKKEFTYYLDGKAIINKVKLPDDEDWDLFQLGKNIYFLKKEYKNELASIFGATYDYQANQIGEVKKLIETESNSNPFRYSPSPLQSKNKKYFTVRINPGLQSYNSSSSISYLYNSTSIAIIDENLNLLYQKNIQFQFDQKEFNYDVSNFLGDDGSWYWFGIKYAGKGKTKIGTYGCYVTDPEGQTSEFKNIPVNSGFVADVNNVLADGKLIQYGTWSEDDRANSFSGGFYLELDLKTLKVQNLQLTSFSAEELSKFVYVAFAQSKLEKSMNVPGVSQLGPTGDIPQFEDGRFISVYQRKIYTAGDIASFEKGSILIMTYGPKASDMTHEFIQVHQNSKGGREIAFASEAIFANNLLVIFLNDHKNNIDVTNNSEPIEYVPFPIQQNSATAFAITYNQNGVITRQQISSYKEDDLLFYTEGAVLSDNSFIIYMAPNPPMKMLENEYYYDYEKLIRYTVTISE